MKHIETLEEMLPEFKGFTKEEKAYLHEYSFLEPMKEGTMLLESGKICSQVFFLLSGQIRVYKTLPDGKEITLYRISGGEFCLFSLTCILKQTPMDALAQVEKSGEILVIPEGVFKKMVRENEQFQFFIMSRIFTAFSEVLALLEEVTFHSMSQRMAKLLLDHMDEEGCLFMTHEDLARELGTAREVVSRLLKEMEKKEMVALQRGALQVLDKEKLEILKVL